MLVRRIPVSTLVAMAARAEDWSKFEWFVAKSKFSFEHGTSSTPIHKDDFLGYRRITSGQPKYRGTYQVVLAKLGKSKVFRAIEQDYIKEISSYLEPAPNPDVGEGEKQPPISDTIPDAKVTLKAQNAKQFKGKAYLKRDRTNSDIYINTTDGGTKGKIDLEHFQWRKAEKDIQLETRRGNRIGNVPSGTLFGVRFVSKTSGGYVIIQGKEGYVRIPIGYDCADNIIAGSKILSTKEQSKGLAERSNETTLNVLENINADHRRNDDGSFMFIKKKPKKEPTEPKTVTIPKRTMPVDANGLPIVIPPQRKPKPDDKSLPIVTPPQRKPKPEPEAKQDLPPVTPPQRKPKPEPSEPKRQPKAPPPYEPPKSKYTYDDNDDDKYDDEGDETFDEDTGSYGYLEDVVLDDDGDIVDTGDAILPRPGMKVVAKNGEAWVIVHMDEDSSKYSLYMYSLKTKQVRLYKVSNTVDMNSIPSLELDGVVKPKDMEKYVKDARTKQPELAKGINKKGAA